MGGMPSAPELAPCVETVFGLDADVISWDYGMTDLGDIGVPNRPAMVDINLDSGVTEGDSFPLQMWTLVTRRLEDLGLTAFYLQPSASRIVRDLIPDMFGLNAQQINDTPEYVRNFKCQDKIEKGDPYCDEQRFTIPNDTEHCDTHKGRVDWHPGWRAHAVTGNLMAFFMIDSLVEALKTLQQEVVEAEQGSSSSLSDGVAATLMERYQAEQDANYKLFHEQFNPDIMSDPLPLLEGLDDAVKPYLGDLFGSENVICHTALLPAEARYRGYLTPTRKTTTTSTTTEEEEKEGDSWAISPLRFDEGMPRNVADALVYDRGDGSKRVFHNLTLVQSENNHENDQCPILISIDYADYYFSGEKMGWTKLTVPTPRYAAAYTETSGKDLDLKGLVMVCHVLCPWGECPDGDLSEKDLGKGLELRVNSKKVKDMIKLGDHCFILVPDDNNNNNKYFPANDRGQYRLEVLVEKTSEDFESYFRLTSLIVL
eukprot:CAMPEP_0116555494 /NCGR_PEP_ID=MMETSP0397-20121206/8178_1 /TAXON_ID=216820 /ORGANISM="Cyclophora tenuis, Strain ECT3854" /LENGTH=483 /DNA_ID=CAMNT_0004080771 /DNA_START=47 /DNA_END=1499 /DNA_ORIENTATION=-